jgi:hypothetical protein
MGVYMFSRWAVNVVRIRKMKKSKVYVVGVLAMVLTLRFMLGGCENNSDDEPIPKSIRITGFDVEIPETTNNTTGVKGKYLYIGVGAAPDSSELASRRVINPSGQDIIFELLNEQPWTGTGSYYIWMERPPKYDFTKSGGFYSYSVNGTDSAPVDIHSAVTTLKWSNFVWRGDFNAG